MRWNVSIDETNSNWQIQRLGKIIDRFSDYLWSAADWQAHASIEHCNRITQLCEVYVAILHLFQPNALPIATQSHKIFARVLQYLWDFLCHFSYTSFSHLICKLLKF